MFCIFVLFGVKFSEAGLIKLNNMVGRMRTESYSNRRISRSSPVFFRKTKEDSFHKLVYHRISLLQIGLVYYAVWCPQMPRRACHFFMPKVPSGIGMVGSIVQFHMVRNLCSGRKTEVSCMKT